MAGSFLSVSLDFVMAAGRQSPLLPHPDKGAAGWLTGAIPIKVVGMMLLYTAPPWDRAMMATGVNYLVPTIYARGQGLLSVLFRETRILSYREGPLGTVTVATPAWVHCSRSTVSRKQAPAQRPRFCCRTTPWRPERTSAAHWSSSAAAATRRAFRAVSFRRRSTRKSKSSTVEAGRFFDSINHRPDL